MARKNSDIYSSLYFEYYAAALLEDCLPEYYSNIEHIGRNFKPDLKVQQHNSGIEFTTVYRGTKIQSFYDEYCGKSISIVPQEVIDYLANNNCFFTVDDQKRVFTLSFPDILPCSTIEDIYFIIDKKTKILNKQHYIVFNSQELFIFSDIKNPSEYAEQLFMYVKSNADFPKHYDIIYILSKRKTLLQFQIAQEICTSIFLPHNDSFYDSIAFRKAYPERV